MILVDAGPLIALLDASDDHHEACVAALRKVREPLLTVWPAVTEAMHLLAFSSDAQDALVEMLQREAPGLARLDAADLTRMRELMRKYRDLPMDLADAAIVAVAERERCRKVFTIDRSDFLVYRPAKLGRFTLLP
jgi:uncharacterized protein